jgi:hypothetical protein
VLVWIPFYWEIKLVFILWLQWPRTRGAILIYVKYIRPFLKANEAEIDKQIDGVTAKLKDPAYRLSTSLINSAVNTVIDYQSNQLKEQLTGKDHDKTQ